MKTKTKTIVSNIVSTVCPALAGMALFLSSIQPASAQVTWTGAGNPGNDSWSGGGNWTPGDPVAYNSLLFPTSVTGTSLNNNNNFTAGTPFDGITIDASGASQYTLAGNSLELSGQDVSGYAGLGIVNKSTVAQTISAPLTLDWGYYTFSSTASPGTLALNGGLTLNTGGVAYFDANNTTSGGSALTADGIGLITGLDGAGVIYSTGTGAPATSTGSTSCLATVSSGAIVPYTFQAGETYTGGGTFVNGGNNNILSTDTGVGPTYNASLSINTLTSQQVGGPTVSSSPATVIAVGALTFANNGGIYVPDPASSSVCCVYVGNGTMTAGTGSAPANLIFCVNGGNNAGQNQVEAGQLCINSTCTIADNGGSGPVTVIKTGPGSMSLDRTTGNTYTGGTYVLQGMLNAEKSTDLGTGPVYIASGACVAFQSTGTFANNFYLSPGPSVTTYPTVDSASGPVPNEGSLQWYSTTTLTGTLTLQGAPTLTAGQADKMSDNFSGGTVYIAGQITGTGTLEIGGTIGLHSPTILLTNETANPNNWQGGLILDMNHSSGSSIFFKAGGNGTGNQIPAGANITLIPAVAPAECRFDLDGQSATINGLYSPAIVSTEYASIRDTAIANATLTMGQGGATATFTGKTIDAAGHLLSIYKTGAGTQVMSGILAHGGTTTVNQGTLDISGALNTMTGPVVVSGGTLELDSVGGLGTSQTLTITAPGAVYLNFSGTQNIAALYFDLTQAEAGTYGAVGSGATHQSGIFTGAGILNVTGGPATPITLYYNTQPSPSSGNNNPYNWSPTSADWNDQANGSDPNQDWVGGCYAYFGASDLTSVPENLQVPAGGIDTPGITVATASADFGLVQPQGSGANITLDSDPVNPGYCTINLQGRNLYLNALLEGGNGLYITGTPLNSVQCVLNYSAAATYTGNTYIGQEVTVENTQGFGPSGTIIFAGGLLKAANAAGNSYFLFPNPVQIVGNNTVCPFGSANNWMYFNGPVNISGTGDQLWVGNIDVTFYGVISGNDLNVVNYVNGSSSQTATVILAGASPNTYSGGTTVMFQNGPAGATHSTLLDAQTAGSLGTGNVSVGPPLSGSGCTLQLDNGAEMASTATLSVAVGGTVNCTYAGTETINALYVGGIQQPAGVYGASGAPNGNPSGVFAGSGTITVGSGPPIPITSETIVGGQLNICWTSVTGGQYNIYTTTTLQAPEPWMLVSGSPVTGAAGTTTCFTLPGAVSGNPQIFVRVMQ